MACKTSSMTIIGDKTSSIKPFQLNLRKQIVRIEIDIIHSTCMKRIKLLVPICLSSVDRHTTRGHVANYNHAQSVCTLHACTARALQSRHMPAAPGDGDGMGWNSAEVARR